MQSDNSTYTVTSPDLYLNEDGLNILITSTNEELVKEIKLLFEKYIQSSIVFNVQPRPTNEGTLPWLWNISQTCDLMIIDMDSCAWVDVCASLVKTVDQNHNVIYYSERDKKRDGVRLINALNKYMILKSLDEVDAFLKLELGSEL